MSSREDYADRQCTWDDIQWERDQHARQLAAIRAQHAAALDVAARIAASYTTVGERVMRAAMKRRKVVRLDELLDGVERVILS